MNERLEVAVARGGEEGVDDATLSRRVAVRLGRVIAADSERSRASKGCDEPEKGFEPLTPRLQGACSDQLSYSGARPMVVAVPYETQGAGSSRRP